MYDYNLSTEHETATDERRRMIAAIQAKRQSKERTVNRKRERRAAWMLKGRA